MEEIATLQLGEARSQVFIAGEGEALPQVDLVLADTNTAQLGPGFLSARRVVVPAGEACKEMAILDLVLQECSRAGLRRDSVIAAVGGGAVTDLGAMVAGVYLRGVQVVLVPTSLLAMVDAAIGGKTGIDFRGYKNLVGVFHPATSVFVIPSLLKTLSDREYHSGLAEVIKAALLADPQLLLILEEKFDEVLKRDPAVLREMIRRAVQVKAQVVNEDFRETGVRAHLNLGHTFGHALEACLGLSRWTHGEAVAWGIARALDAGVRLGLTDPTWRDRVMSLLQHYQYPVDQFPCEPEALIAAMQHDKKRRREGIRFILQRGAQDTLEHEIPAEILKQVVSGATRPR